MATLELCTETGCGLAIGRYPRFAYNASGGGGSARLGPGDGAGWRPLRFDPAQLLIPDLSWRTTRVLGLPLPPGLRIAVLPERLEGRWHPEAGAVELAFEARFQFSLAGLYRAPDLIVHTQLSTGPVVGPRHRAVGVPLDGQGRGLLVGVAAVPPTGEGWLDRFLGLPDGALALLRCSLRPDDGPPLRAPAAR
jgi:hypothetical protein